MKRYIFSCLVLTMALLSLGSCVRENKSTVAVLAVNDMHAAIDHMPQFAALADSLRGVYPDLLVFSAGDNRTGNPVNDQYEPTNYPMIAFMNKVGFDACAVGNHEWDGSLEGFQKNIEDAHFPYLCANVEALDGVRMEVKPYVILQNQGLKIAVVGAVETRADGRPGAHPMHFTHLRFRNGREVVPEYRFLRDEANICIFLSHMGYEEDIDIAEKNAWLDAIIGGHSHTLVEFPEKHNGVMVTQAGSHLNYATLVLFETVNGKVADVKATTLDVAHFGKENAEVRSMLNAFNDDSRFKETLATALTPFKRREELGCLITDGMRAITGADFAFNNTGGIRINGLPKGPITVKDVYDIDPFNNEVVVYHMTGSQLENYIMSSFKANGRQPSYVSGMTCHVNTDADGYPKSVDIKPDHGRYSRNATYTVAMNSYMASTIRFQSVDEGQSQYMTSEEMVIQYLRQKKTVSYEGVRRVSY